uniref:Putative UDP-glucuronosyl/UDP-glucosyltransferase n=1 Tax=Helianthus annuus TaxID=4232 RepID=A0A251VBC8_HELAN
MINQTGSSRVVGFVVDVFCTGMIDVANEFNLPTYVFFTSSSAFLGFNLYIETLCVDHNQDHVIELSNSKGEIVVPSFVNPVPKKAFPADYWTQEGLDFVICSIRDLRKAKGIMVNTFLELETHVMKSFTDTNFPPVYPVGPVLNLDVVVKKAHDMDVIRWLDGSSEGDSTRIRTKWSSFCVVPTLSPHLAQSFEDPKVLLPDGFLERTVGIGKVIGWAPQVSLLAHEAVGGFVTHCGWNSILESLWFGVPMTAWPVYAEQQLNAFEMVVELRLAVDLKLDYKMDLFNPNVNTTIVTTEEVERGIRRVMEDNKVRAKVKEMSKLSRATLVEGGSSYASVGYLVQEIMSNII